MRKVKTLYESALYHMSVLLLLNIFSKNCGKLSEGKLEELLNELNLPLRLKEAVRNSGEELTDYAEKYVVEFFSLILFRFCRSGNLEAVEYLFNVADSEIRQRLLISGDYQLLLEICTNQDFAMLEKLWRLASGPVLEMLKNPDLWADVLRNPETTGAILQFIEKHKRLKNPINLAEIFFSPVSSQGENLLTLAIKYNGKSAQHLIDFINRLWNTLDGKLLQKILCFSTHIGNALEAAFSYEYKNPSSLIKSLLELYIAYRKKSKIRWGKLVKPTFLSELIHWAGKKTEFEETFDFFVKNITFSDYSVNEKLQKLLLDRIFVLLNSQILSLEEKGIIIKNYLSLILKFPEKWLTWEEASTVEEKLNILLRAYENHLYERKENGENYLRQLLFFKGFSTQEKLVAVKKLKEALSSGLTDLKAIKEVPALNNGRLGKLFKLYYSELSKSSCRISDCTVNYSVSG
ncbi:hypothetical protein [Coxiella burnetii]|uniref:hypothetical protein n=1 Tax=Coxiella burnetii TaxID=777 RepID=UPI0000DAE96A|nr:hypothetical protein [Coxiella burnetii]ABX78927.1 hypothetical protein COXBURSA331_A1067 [Coxiella burnetii RSA 331]ATN82056.1 hypothetical protein AYO24_04995 [Coxiella burnetii]ATN83958.1 hypothetical protein AYO23_05010 [Coxiella burnetii]POZ79101.1 hypothetical protein CbuRSA461_05160 [Coxiella burnetii]